MGLLPYRVRNELIGIAIPMEPKSAHGTGGSPFLLAAVVEYFGAPKQLAFEWMAWEKKSERNQGPNPDSNSLGRVC